MMNLHLLKFNACCGCGRSSGTMGIRFWYEFGAQIFVISNKFEIDHVLHSPEMHPPFLTITRYSVKFAA